MDLRLFTLEPKGQYICDAICDIYDAMGLCNIFFVHQDLIYRIISYFQKIAFRNKLLLTGF